MSQTTTEPGSTSEPGSTQQEQTFTQAEVDQIIGRTRSEERRKASEKYADYDDLKTRAAEATSLREQITDLTSKGESAEARALRAEVALDKGLTISQAKRLVGSSKEELEADADELLADIGAQQKQGNHSPREGQTTTKSSGGDGEMRDFVRDLWADATAD